ILLVDAFSSDAVPSHLMTVEAMRLYLSMLKADGLLILHLSNRHLDLMRPAVAAVRAAGGCAGAEVFSSQADVLWEEPVGEEEAGGGVGGDRGDKPRRAGRAWRGGWLARRRCRRRDTLDRRQDRYSWRSYPPRPGQRRRRAPIPTGCFSGPVTAFNALSSARC